MHLSRVQPNPSSQLWDGPGLQTPEKQKSLVVQPSPSTHAIKSGTLLHWVKFAPGRHFWQTLLGLGVCAATHTPPAMTHPVPLGVYVHSCVVGVFDTQRSTVQESASSQITWSTTLQTPSAEHASWVQPSLSRSQAAASANTVQDVELCAESHC